MPNSFFGRMRNVWNVLTNADQYPMRYVGSGYSSAMKPDRVRLRLGGADRSIVAAIYNRIAIDVASIAINHVRLDEEGRYSETIKDSLNDCLTTSANIDQTGRALIQDLAMTMFDQGCAAVVPVEVSGDPLLGTYEIYSLRVGYILEWFPAHIRVRLYDDRTGQPKEVVLPKADVAIIENPLYAVMNEPNSMLQRLIRKLNMLDAVDEQTSSGKLDLIIQLPYVIKTPARQKQAEIRRNMIEQQLSGSKYGIAYTDGTEKITQLNRAVENNLLSQIEYLTNMVFNQLGLTESIFDGTADEATMLNYNNRTIEPIISAFTGEFKRKWLTKTAITQGQSITFFRDPFRLVPVSQIADIADKFTRNAILSPNEIRPLVGFKPTKDGDADVLRNRNINEGSNDSNGGTTGDGEADTKDE